MQQEFLTKNPKLDIRVYAIWFSMLATDTPDAFPAARAVLPDPRVEHYWDSEKAAGAWFKANIPNNYDRPIMWDAYYLFDARAEWKQKPEPLLVWGRPIIPRRQDLLKLVPQLSANRNK